MLYYFFTALALAFLTFLSYHHHRTAIILLAAFLPTYLLRLSIFGLPAVLAGLPTNFLELAIVLVALAGFIQPASRSRWRAAWQQLPISFKVLTFLFVLAAAISTYISPHPSTSLGILKSWIAVPILLGWLIYSSGTKKSSIINALLISGVAVSIVGLFQMNTLDRIQSVYDVPNSLALFLTPLLVMASWQAMRGLRGVLWMAILVMAAALILTQSASALIAITLTLSLGIIFLAKPSSRKRALAALALFFILAAVYFSSTGRLAYLTQFPNSISVRFQLWSISWDLIKENPLLGIGLGTFEPAYQQKLHEKFTQGQSPLPEFVFRDSHNWVLSFWLNTGLLGLLSFVGIHVFIAWKIFRRRKLLVTSYQLLAPALALLALLIFGLTDTIYFKNDLAALHWVLLATLLTTPDFPQSKLISPKPATLK